MFITFYYCLDGYIVQDNARPHPAHMTMDFMNNTNAHVMPWPALSPDLSPSEPLWDVMFLDLL